MKQNLDFDGLVNLVQENIILLNNGSGKDSLIESVFLPMYKYLQTRQMKNGGIFDTYKKSYLNFQYHVPYFIFSSIILSKICSRGEYLDNAEKSIQYLIQLEGRVTNNPSSFNAIPLLLSLSINNDEKINSLIINYIKQKDFYPSLKLKNRRANNLYAFKGLSHFLRGHQIPGKLSNLDMMQGKKIILEHLVGWQLSDGFFYDKPFEMNSNNVVIHLTYHATMMMVLAFSGFFIPQKELRERTRKAIYAMQKVTSPAGEAFSYGRSNNAIFGYASGILGCSLYQSYVSVQDPKINNFRNDLFKYIIQYQDSDGHLYIVPNDLEEKRIGFDKYMFVSVYESYALALLLLSHLLVPLNNDNT